MSKISEDPNILYNSKKTEGVTNISFTNTNPCEVQAEIKATLTGAEWVKEPTASLTLKPNQETFAFSYKPQAGAKTSSFSFKYYEITQPSVQGAVSTKSKLGSDTNFERVSPVVEQIIKEGKPFIDADFTPVVNNVYHEGYSKKPERIYWRRAGHLYAATKVCMFQGNKVDADSVIQGALGNCWFLAAVAGVANMNPTLIERLFITKTINPAGIYELRLFKNGSWRRVVVDDYIPCRNGSPIFTKSKDPEIWILLLEKAYAKLHGSYMRIEGGKASEAFEDLTGCPGVTTNWPSNWDKYTSNDIFRVIKSKLDEKCFVSVSTLDDNTIEAKGLTPNHAYSVLDAVQIMNFKLLKLRNPWRRFEWNGDWGDNSSTWNPELKALLGVSTDNDGVFWIEMGDVWKYFTTLNFGYFDLNYLFCNQSLSGVAAKRGNKYLCESFEIECHEDDTTVCIGIHQDDPRVATTTTPLRYLHAFLIDKETSQIVTDVTTTQKARTIVMKAELLAGKTYVILPWIIEQLDTNFIVQVMANQKVGLKKEATPFDFAENLDLTRAHDNYVPSDKYKRATKALSWKDVSVESYKYNFTEVYFLRYKKRLKTKQADVKLDVTMSKKNSSWYCKEEPADGIVTLEIKPGECLCIARGCAADPSKSWNFSWSNIGGSK